MSVSFNYGYGHVNIMTRTGCKDAAIRDAIGWIQHWRRDVEGGLKPTLESLKSAEDCLVDALKSKENA